MVIKRGRVFRFQFRVNRSFMGQPDHPVTLRRVFYGALPAVLGELDHSSRPILVITAEGEETEGRIRHSRSGGGDYYQLNCVDHDIANGLAEGDLIWVELWNESAGPEIRLVRS